jgi:hypothetical protein
MTAGPGAPRSTDALIARLTADVVPVRRSWPPRARFALWLAVAAAALGAALALLGLRPDVGARLAGLLGPEIALLLAVGVADALLALLAAVPGREPSPALAAASLAGLVALAVLYGLEPAIASTGHRAADGWPCAVRTLAVAAVPWVVLLVAVRRGATLVPVRAGLLAAIGAYFVAAAALRLVCPLDAREHLLLWHLGPVLLGLVASLLVGRSWLARWGKRRG